MNSQKQFGVWMDTSNAFIVGRESEDGELAVLANVKGEDVSPNSSEKTSNNHAKTVQAKFFKEITAYMQNATFIHVTGTGQAQEQFIHYLEETPQFKNTKTEESTSKKMNDEALTKFFSDKLK